MKRLLIFSLSIILSFSIVSCGGVSFENEYCLTVNNYMGLGGTVDVTVKFQKLERNSNYKGEYEYHQIMNGGSSLDLYEKGRYVFSKDDKGKESLVLVPTFKDGREMDYDWSDGLNENIMILLVDDSNFSSLTFDLRGWEGYTLERCN